MSILSPRYTESIDIGPQVGYHECREKMIYKNYKNTENREE